jgi:hypothetical protein
VNGDGFVIRGHHRCGFSVLRLMDAEVEAYETADLPSVSGELTKC